MKLFIAPHQDDETLFGAFTILREHPVVLFVTDSKRQEAKGITAQQRNRESLEALAHLGAEGVTFLHIPDATLTANELRLGLEQFFAKHGPFEHVYAPVVEPDGNADHNVIGLYHFGLPTTRYLTYTKLGKSRSGNMVSFERNWPLIKLRALVCYKSQILEPSTRDHFLRDQYEYYA